MSGFFEELKRRKVYRVAAAYIVVAGGMIQLASAVFPAWELPNWSLRLTIVLLLIGFPIALVLAWAFDVTPQGIQTTQPLTKTASGVHRRRNIVLLIALGLVISACAGFFLLLPRASAGKMEKSIAVLPFDNYSDDKENAYFADGIQDDILTKLAKISDLKVISRTSVMAYRDSNRNVREIGKALGASAILEGSVRKDHNRVRVNVQLINAETDQHLWANEYDRDLTDMFAIQSDLAQKIAEELKAKLSPTEKAQLTRRPTENGEAYLAFIQARNLFRPQDFETNKQAEQLFERALELDPKFALAAADLSRLESWIYRTFEALPERRERARSLAQLALRLQPDLPEAHLALGFSYYYGDNDYDAAEKEFIIAQAGLPNESSVFLALGAIQRRQGRWSESNTNLEKAAELDPKSTWALQNLALNYEMLRDYGAANKTIDRALAIDPDAIPLLGIKAKIALEENGDMAPAARTIALLEKMPESPLKAETLETGKLAVLSFQRKFAEALQVCESVPDNSLQSKPGLTAEKYLRLGLLHHFLNDDAAAKIAFAHVKDLAEARVQKDPQSWDAHIHLGYALAYLGDKNGAAAQAERAMEALPESKDTFDGPEVTAAAAKIYAAIGDKDRAIGLITGLLKRPAAFTVAMLKLDPEWDPLRNDPRFQQLIAK